MRLDKYLKVSRLIKRRTVANEACDSGRVLINDKPAKASANVKEGYHFHLFRQQGSKSRGPGCTGDREKRRSQRTFPLYIISGSLCINFHIFPYNTL